MKNLIVILLIIGMFKLKITRKGLEKTYNLSIPMNIIALILLYLYIWR